MQLASKPRTEPPQASATEFAVRKWLVTFGSLFNREITPFLIGSWCEMLAGLSGAQVEAGCRQIAQTWTFSHFPTPGAVLSQFDKAAEKGFALEAEREWQNLLDWIRAHVFPDTGIQRGAPRLKPAVEHAAKAAGGIFYIERCSTETLVWCRKNFLAAYTNVHDTGQAEHLLSSGDAKRILGELSAGVVERKKLAPTVVPETFKPERSEVRAVLNRIVADMPRETPGDEELERRRDEMKRKAAEWQASR